MHDVDVYEVEGNKGEGEGQDRTKRGKGELFVLKECSMVKSS